MTVKYRKVLVLLLMIASQTILVGNGRQEKPPNVILILADDMGLGDISAFNEGLNRTPNLDKLLKESVYFSQAYSGSPVCTPSRAALLTGRYPHRTGAITLNMKRYPELSRVHKDETTLADVFKDNGYATGIVGKWHIGEGEEYHPLNRGFEEFEGFKGYDVPDDYFNYRLDINGKYQSFSNEYLTENLTKRAINFVKKHKEEPFFLHLAHYAPHRPLSAPKELVDHYLKKGFDGDTATVYAMIEVMDKGIGKLIDVLENENIREKTLIIFASDNGPDPVINERFDLDQRGTKYTIYEGGIHVPLLFNWKGTLTPSEKDITVHFTDIFPTLLEICELKSQKNLKLDGGSIVGILKGSNSEIPIPKHRFWQWNRGVPYYSHNAAMRVGDWKLVRPYMTRNLTMEESNQKPMLFNIKEDPKEKIDVSEKEKERYNIMLVKLEQWCREVEWDRLSKR
jgi:arylsulfatase A